MVLFLLISDLVFATATIVFFVRSYSRISGFKKSLIKNDGETVSIIKSFFINSGIYTFSSSLFTIFFIIFSIASLHSKNTTLEKSEIVQTGVNSILTVIGVILFCAALSFYLYFEAMEFKSNCLKDEKGANKNIVLANICLTTLVLLSIGIMYFCFKAIEPYMNSFLTSMFDGMGPGFI